MSAERVVNEYESEVHEGLHWMIVAAAGSVVATILAFIKALNDFTLHSIIAFMLLVIIVMLYGAYRIKKVQRDKTKKMKEVIDNLKMNLETQKHLLRWDGLEKVTGLASFSPHLKDSEFHPSKILKRDNLTQLRIIGNGCSKWTHQSSNEGLMRAAAFCRNARGGIQFLVQNPIDLFARGKQPKAARNAKSLLVLKSLTSIAGDKVQIKTYSHTAELRITIINDHETVIGHYAGGDEDSNKSPILHFEDDHSNPWSFHRAWLQHFHAEWELGKTVDDWPEIERISKMEPGVTT